MAETLFGLPFVESDDPALCQAVPTFGEFVDLVNLAYGDMLAAARHTSEQLHDFALTYRETFQPSRIGLRRKRKHGGRLPKLSQAPHGRPHWKLCAAEEYTLRGIIRDTHI